MDIKDFNKRIDGLLKSSVQAIRFAAARVAVSMTSEIKDRIITTGTDSKGKKFVDYSSEYKRFKQDVGRYRGFVDFQLGNYSINKRVQAVEARKRAKAKEMKKKGRISKAKILKKDERKALIKQRRAKAIPSSSTLMSDIQITEKKFIGNVYSIRIAPKSDLNVKKAERIAKKWGNIIAPSQQEMDRAQERASELFAAAVEEALRDNK